MGVQPRLGYNISKSVAAPTGLKPGEILAIECAREGTHVSHSTPSFLQIVGDNAVASSFIRTDYACKASLTLVLREGHPSALLWGVYNLCKINERV